MSKLVVTADYSGVVKEAAKATKENEKAAKAAGSIGREGQKARKPMQDMSKEAGKLGGSLTKAFLRISAIAAVANSIFAGINTALAKASEASATEDQQRQDMAAALTGAGAGRQAASLARTALAGGGVATPAEMQAFAAGLAGTGRQFKPEDLRNLLQQFSKGGVVAYGIGGQDLLQPLSQGMSVSGAVAHVSRRRGAGAESFLRTDAADRIAAVNQSQADEQRAHADRGHQLRARQAVRERWKAQSPILGTALGTLDELNLLGFRPFQHIATSAAGFGSNEEAGAALREHTAALKQNTNAIVTGTHRSRRPALGAQGESAP